MWSTWLVVLLGLFGLALGACLGALIYDESGVVSRNLVNVPIVRSKFPFLFPTFVGRRRPTAVPLHIATFVRKAIKEALDDPVGLPDYALAAEGAKIIQKLTTSSKSDLEKARPPSNILDEDIRSGSCWSFSGDRAQVGIKVSTQLYPTHVTIEHIPRAITAHISHAPRHVVVWGGLDGKDNERRYAESMERLRMSPLNETGEGPPITGGSTFLPLAAFDYDPKAKSHVQTFPIDAAICASRIFFGVFVVEVRSNWGGAMTRLYRVRVHGLEATW
ncbi:hypothetical protein C8Q76DRAFT_606617 [Earliella scabrosa]|nr:hypothetical protein C8Q76DRAFT_632493 [Earliella scabrosa]KAI0744851.1 hypothetical protein C8Q76DRAFT_606617 [Earliella scabrosa]